MYYPKSQIKTGLTSNGNLAFKATNKPYYGKYFSTSDGKYFSGLNPSNSTVELILLSKSTTPPTFEPFDMDKEGLDLRFGTKINYKYSTLKGLPDDSLNPQPPINNSPKPTKKDYTIGEFQRYFCKKTNEFLYLEIDKDTFQQLLDKDSKIIFDLYNPISTPWSLTGTPQSVFNTNKKIIALIERNQKWYGFTNYFQDKFLKYHISEQNKNLYTSGGEYALPNGKTYIGFYHIMNNGSIMTGKEHGTGDDIVLIPISIKVTSSVTPTSSPSPSPQASSGGGGY